MTTNTITQATRIGRRVAVALWTAIVSGGILFAVPHPAAADAPTCAGNSQSTLFGGNVNGGCSSTAPTGPFDAAPLLPPYRWWWPVGPPSGTCISNGQPSFLQFYYTTLVNDPAAPAAEQGVYCFWLPPLTGANLAAQANLPIVSPTITPDFNDMFLTGATVHFGVAKADTTAKAKFINYLPNYTVWVEAKPTSFLWDFGDGTTSTDKTPSHVYQSKAPNPANPSNHTATVTVTITWSPSLHVDGPGTASIQALPPVVVTNTLTRPVVEIWSELANSNV